MIIWTEWVSRCSWMLCDWVSAFGCTYSHTAQHQTSSPPPSPLRGVVRFGNTSVMTVITINSRRAAHMPSYKMHSAAHLTVNCERIVQQLKCIWCCWKITHRHTNMPAERALLYYVMREEAVKILHFSFCLAAQEVCHRSFECRSSLWTLWLANKPTWRALDRNAGTNLIWLARLTRQIAGEPRAAATPKLSSGVWCGDEDNLHFLLSRIGACSNVW